MKKPAAWLCLFLILFPAPTAFAYYDDVHYALTYYIARRVGFTPEQAYRIASATVSVDWDPLTEPVQPAGQFALNFVGYARSAEWPRTLFHAMRDTLRFADPVGRGPDATTADGAVITQRERLWDLAVKETRNPGVFLHFFQDEVPHRGYGSAWGHWPILPDVFEPHLKKNLSIGGSTDWISYRDAEATINRIEDTRLVAEQTAARLARFLDLVSPLQSASVAYRHNQAEFAALVNRLAAANLAPAPLNTELRRQLFIHFKLGHWKLRDIARLDAELRPGTPQADLDSHYDGPSTPKAIAVIDAALEQAGMSDRLRIRHFQYNMAQFTRGASDSVWDRLGEFASSAQRSRGVFEQGLVDRNWDKWVLVGALEVKVLEESAAGRSPMSSGNVTVLLKKHRRDDEDRKLGDAKPLAPGGAATRFDNIPVGDLIVEVRGADGTLRHRQEVQLDRRTMPVELVVKAVDAPTSGPGLEGTWRISGVRRGGWAGPVPEGTITLRSASDDLVKEASATKFGESLNWACQQKAPGAKAYIGTVQWDAGSFFQADGFCWYRARGAAATGPVLLCEYGNAATLKGRLRDEQNMRGASLDLFVGPTIAGTLTQDCNGPTNFGVTLSR